jgi:hypothetical protein
MMHRIEIITENIRGRLKLGKWENIRKEQSLKNNTVKKIRSNTALEGWFGKLLVRIQLNIISI